eukprot:Rhum_TRINITY_DN10184_c0_g1::Rhum_TRINITY_DN10184_c0_g1_i1::g.37220::m.37220
MSRLLLAALCSAACIASASALTPISGVSGVNTVVDAEKGADGKLVIIMFETNLCSMYSSKAQQALTQLGKGAVKARVAAYVYDVTNDAAAIAAFDIGGVPSIRIWWRGRSTTYTGGRTVEEFEELVRLFQGQSVKTDLTCTTGDTCTLGGAALPLYKGSYVVHAHKLNDQQLALFKVVAHNRRNKAVFVCEDCGGTATPATRGALFFDREQARVQTFTGAAGDLPPVVIPNEPMGTDFNTAAQTLSELVDANTYERVSQMSTLAYNRLLERDLIICWLFVDEENTRLYPETVTAQTKALVTQAMRDHVGAGAKHALVTADGRLWYNKVLELVTPKKERGVLPLLACEKGAKHSSLIIADSTDALKLSDVQAYLLGDGAATFFD